MEENEKIVVHSSNNRIAYYEPNNGDDRSIPYPYEDMCIAIDLQVAIPQRTSYGRKCEGVNGFNKNMKSFISGKVYKTPDGKQQQQFLTTSYTNVGHDKITLNGEVGGENEALGIESVNIMYDSWFYPQVEIRFTDVRGESLMQPQEEGNAYTNMQDGEATEILGGSFFKALFAFPYPKFVLYVKGFYGKEVKYDLSVSDFKATFNANNGNFDVTVKFIGFMYGVYSDIPMQYLAIAPYTQSGSKYWEKNENFVYNDEKGIKTNKRIYKCPEFIVKLADIEANRDKTPVEAGYEDAVKCSEVKKSIDKLLNAYDAFKKSLIKDNKGFIINHDGHDLIIFDDGGASYQDTGLISGDYAQFAFYLLDTNKKIQEANLVITKDDDKLKSLSIPNVLFKESDYDTLKTENKAMLVKSPHMCGSNYFVEKGEESLLNHFGGFGFSMIHIISFNDGAPSFTEGARYVDDNGKETIDYYPINDNKIKQLILDYIRTHKGEPGNYLYIDLDLEFKKEIEGILSKIKTVNEDAQDKLDREHKVDTVNKLEFKPSIGNINKMLFAYLDTFVSIYYDCLDNILIDVNKKKRVVPHGGNIETNIPVGSKIKQLPPFTEFYRKNEKGEFEAIFPGDIEEYKNLEEVKFVESLISTASNLGFDIQKQLDAIEKTTEKAVEEAKESESDENFFKSEETVEEEVNVSEYLDGVSYAPITRHDFAFLEDGNPWDNFVNSETTLEDIIRAYIVRYIYYEYFSEYDANDRKETHFFSQIDANNFVAGNKSSNKAKFLFSNKKEYSKDSIRKALTQTFGTEIKNLVKPTLLKDLYNGKATDGCYKYTWIYDVNQENTFLPTSFAPFKKDYFTGLKPEEQRNLVIENKNHDFVPFGGSASNSNTCVIKKNNSGLGLYENVCIKAQTDYLNGVDSTYRTKYNTLYHGLDKENPVFGENDKNYISHIVGSDEYNNWLNSGQVYSQIINPFCRWKDRFIIPNGWDNEYIYTEQEFYDQNTLDADKRLLAKAFYFLMAILIKITDEDGNRMNNVDRIYGSLLKEGAVLWLYENRANLPVKNFSVKFNRRNTVMTIEEKGYDYRKVSYNIDGINASRKAELIKLFTEWANSDFKTLNGLLEITKSNGTEITDVDKAILVKEGAGTGHLYHENYVVYDIKKKNNYNKKHFVFKQLRGDNESVQGILKSIFCHVYSIWELDYRNNEKLDKNGGIDNHLEFAVEEFINNVAKRYNVDKEDVVAPDYTTVTAIEESIEDDEDRNAPKAESNVKLACYMTLKNLFDKHFCGRNDTYWKIFTETGEKKVSEYNKFRFVDSRYKDISFKFPINAEYVAQKFKDNISLSDNIQEPNSKGYVGYTFYEMLHTICADNHMLLLALPMPFGNRSEKDVEEMFTPQPFTSLGSQTATDVSYIGIYSYLPSHTLDMGDGKSSRKGVEFEYVNDGFDFENAWFKGGNSAEKVFTKDADDMTTYTIPAFGVTFAKGNQSFFKNISVDMSTPQITDAAIQTTQAIASKAAKGGSGGNISGYVYGADLFKVYSQYSYTCTVEMLGCMEVTPMMYFQLNNIPMFHGAYMITNVQHTISQGNMITKFTGVRQSIHTLPIETFGLGETNLGCASDGESQNTTGESVRGNLLANKVDVPIVNGLPIHTSKRTKEIEYLVIHYTAGSTSKTGAAMQNAKMFADPTSRNASADFIVDDTTQVQFNPDPLKYYCYAVGDPGSSSTGGREYKGKAFNGNCISIEICSSYNPSKWSKYPDPNATGWYFTPEVLNQARQLAKYLMAVYHIPKKNVIRHYDVTGKLCPGIKGWNTYQLGDGTTNNDNEWRKFWNSL